MGRANYVKLTNLSDLRRFMGKLINQRNNDEIGTSIFRDLIYGLRSFREVLELEVIQNDINKRLADIEGNKYQTPDQSDTAKDRKWD